jgi:hypothetical protein
VGNFGYYKKVFCCILITKTVIFNIKINNQILTIDKYLDYDIMDLTKLLITVL